MFSMKNKSIGVRNTKQNENLVEKQFPILYRTNMKVALVEHLKAYYND